MSNFFQQQQAARTRTKLLVVLYGLAVLAIACASYLLLLVAFSQSGVAELSSAWQPEVFLLCLLGTLALVVLGSLYKFSQLSAGAGASIAQELGGTLITPDTKDPSYKRLLNIVEEMALAAGIAVPPVYVLAEEQGINAFAAGFSPSQAVLGVTQGTLSRLSRDELQGVIGHEFSHILNGDMRLNLRILAVLHGLLLLSLVGRGFLEISGASSRRRRYRYTHSSNSSSGKDKDPGAALAVFGIGLLALGYIGVFFGRLIKSAVSRQREFLADASAVQFTRNPLGISGALKKIGGLVVGSRIQTSKAEEASHMFFANGMGNYFTQLLATHPPIIERLERIEGRRYSSAELASFAQEQAASSVATEGSAGFSAASEASSRAPSDSAPSNTVSTDPQEAFQQIGEIPPAAVSSAQQLLASLPLLIQQAARSPAPAQELVLALIKAQVKAGVDATDADPLRAALRELPSTQALSLLDLCIPALHQLETNQRTEFLQRIRAAVMEDQQVSLFEYALFWTLRSRLQADEGSALASLSAERFREVAGSCLAHLATLSGHTSDSEALKVASNLLGVASVTDAAPDTTQRLAMLEKALIDLRDCIPSQKEKICGAFRVLVLHDNKATSDERMLLRALHAALDCPVPLLP